jgi:O-antigen/teichoic acid export membrane protein
MKDIWNQFKIITNKFRDLSFYSIGTLVTNGIGGIFWLYIASLLGTEEYGELSYIISIGIMAGTISLAGMSNLLIIYGAKNIKIQSTIFLIGLISSGITALIIFFFIDTNIIISLYIIGFVIFTLVTAELIGQKLFLKYSKILIIQKIMLVIFSIVLYHLIGLEGIMLGIAISFLVFILMMYKTFREVKINFSILKSKYKFSINSFLLDISNAFHGSLDKIIIAPILGFSLLGNYQLGLQFIGLLYLIPGMLFSYALTHDASGNSTKLVKKIIVMISIIFAVISIIMAPILLPILFPQFTEAIVVIQIMSLSIVPSAIASTYISKYLGSENSKIVIGGSGLYLSVQIISIIVLGQMYELNGVALSVVISSIVHVVYFIIIDKLYYKN